MLRLYYDCTTIVLRVYYDCTTIVLRLYCDCTSIVLTTKIVLRFYYDCTTFVLRLYYDHTTIVLTVLGDTEVTNSRNMKTTIPSSDRRFDGRFMATSSTRKTTIPETAIPTSVLRQTTSLSPTARGQHRGQTRVMGESGG